MGFRFRKPQRVGTVRRGSTARPGVESLELRCLMAAPVIDPINSVAANVPVGKTLFIPVTGSDADGNPITYSVTSSDPSVSATVRTTGNTYLTMKIANFGTMEFQLFGDLTPNTVATISGLVKAGFYDGLTIHRVVPNFIIQGGDPAGNGSGGPGFSFPDEFNLQAIFDGNGQLAMANSGNDTNGSQFFVTLGTQRSLDFNHTIYGQLVRGFDVLQAIDPVTGQNE